MNKFAKDIDYDELVRRLVFALIALNNKYTDLKDPNFIEMLCKHTGITEYQYEKIVLDVLKEPDWEIDTPVLVRTNIFDVPKPAYYAGYKNGKYEVWAHGATSRTSIGKCFYLFAELDDGAADTELDNENVDIK